jgi:hypothetical protein
MFQVLKALAAKPAPAVQKHKRTAEDSAREIAPRLLQNLLAARPTSLAEIAGWLGHQTPNGVPSVLKKLELWRGNGGTPSLCRENVALLARWCTEQQVQAVCESIGVKSETQMAERIAALPEMTR